MKARRLGLMTSRLPAFDEGGELLRLSPVNVEDLLLRPSVTIDYRRLEQFVKGRSIIVTGGGGSIGGEIGESDSAIGDATRPGHRELRAGAARHPGAARRRCCRRRGRHGDDFHRQGDRAGIGRGRIEALRGNDTARHWTTTSPTAAMGIGAKHGSSQCASATCLHRTVRWCRNSRSRSKRAGW